MWIPDDSRMLLARVSNLVTNVNISKALQPSEEDSGPQVSETEVPGGSKAGLPHWVFNDRRVVPECTPS